MSNEFPFLEFANAQPAIHEFTSVPSTNDIAKGLLSDSSFVCVQAVHQTNGRGRHGKQWQTDDSENVCCSIGMRYAHPIPMHHGAFLQIIGTLAVQKTINTIEPTVQCTIKYPNDVYSRTQQQEYKKVSGVLLETEVQNGRITQSILGIGINCNVTTFPDELISKATSLTLLTNRIYSPGEITTILVNNILQLFRESVTGINNLWQTSLCLEKKVFTIVNQTDTWLFDTFTPEGMLMLYNPNSKEKRLIHDGDSILYSLE